MRKHLMRVLVVLSILIILGLLMAPFVFRALSLPHNSLRLNDALTNLQIARASLEQYQASHNDLRPQSFKELKEHAVAPGGDYTSDEIRFFKKMEYMYYPNAQGSQPLVLCYLPYRGADCVCWLTADGEIWSAQSRQWPRWHLRRNGQLRWS